MTSMDEAVQQLVEQLTKRKRYLHEIKALAQQQKGAIAESRQEELVDLLEAREQLMAQVDALDKADQGSALQLIRTAGEEKQGVPFRGVPPEALTVVGEIKTIIGEIQSLDGENMASAREQQAELRRQLEGINKHRRSKELYTGEGKSITGAFLNKTR